MIYESLARMHMILWKTAKPIVGRMGLKSQMDEVNRNCGPCGPKQLWVG